MHRIAVLSGLVMTLLVPIGPPTPAAMAAAVAITEDVALTPVATGMSFVLDVDAPSGDPRLFIVEKAGLIRVMVDGDLLPTPFLDIRARVNDSASERGLLGIAFAPNYATTGEFYVNYTAEPDGRTRISEFAVSQADPDVADAGSEKILLSVSQPAGNHNGGALAFGGDGFLYVALGDGGGGGDTFGNGQNTSTLLGSILRIARTGAAAPGNPFIGQPGQDRIWAYGVRNPWRMAVDPATDDIWFGDVGQDAWEEVDRIPAGVGGLKFEWNTREGDH